MDEGKFLRVRCDGCRLFNEEINGASTWSQCTPDKGGRQVGARMNHPCVALPPGFEDGEISGSRLSLSSA